MSSPDDPYRPPPDDGRPSGPPPSGGPYFSPLPHPGPSPRGGGSRGWGVATGIVAPLLLAVGVPALLALTGSSDWFGTGLVAVVGPLPLLLLLGAVVLTAVPRTRRFGTGVLLGLGILLLVGAGTCIALIATLSAANV